MEGQSVYFWIQILNHPSLEPSSNPPLTYSSVVHAGVVHPAQRLLHLALQGDGGFGWSHIGHGAVGLGLQGQQRRSNLLGQCTSLRAVTFTPETKTDREMIRGSKQKGAIKYRPEAHEMFKVKPLLDTILKGNTTIKGWCHFHLFQSTFMFVVCSQK